MGPQRLLLLGGLIYVAWRLFRSLIQEKITKELRRQEQDSGKREPEAEDVLVEDLICRRLIPRKQSVRLRHDDKTYYFCSETCCDIFISEQEGSAG